MKYFFIDLYKEFFEVLTELKPATIGMQGRVHIIKSVHQLDPEIEYLK